jgi:hypothetical protein
MLLINILTVALAGLVSGHIHIIDPAPIRSKENPYSGNAIDYDINNPLTSMSMIPCKGALSYFNSPQGTPVKTYARGRTYQMVMGTGADHSGGSCQISLSYDQGSSFTVIKSIIGGCAAQNGVWSFTIPSDAPTGKAVFSWSWINRVGNREFYQNCAAVTISASIKNRADEEAPEQREAAPSFSSRPKIFVANVGNGWCVREGIDVVYPDPGPDVQNTSTNPGPPHQCRYVHAPNRNLFLIGRLRANLFQNISRVNSLVFLDVSFKYLDHRPCPQGGKTEAIGVSNNKWETD